MLIGCTCYIAWHDIMPMVRHDGSSQWLGHGGSILDILGMVAQVQVGTISYSGRVLSNHALGLYDNNACWHWLSYFDFVGIAQALSPGVSLMLQLSLFCSGFIDWHMLSLILWRMALAVTLGITLSYSSAYACAYSSGFIALAYSWQYQSFLLIPV